MVLEERLIVALDVPNIDKASKLIIGLGETVCFYKVGMELFYGAGPEMIAYLKEFRKKIFLDLKLHDIPNTVASSIKVLTQFDVDMLTIHAGGGREMMKAAAQAAKKAAAEAEKKAPKILGVTVLTSIDDKQFSELNNKLSLQEQVISLAKLAQESGLDGVVASPEEAGLIRKACGQDFLIVTPGIRLEDAKTDDQSRIATPCKALNAGSSHLVVGRPITKAQDLKAAALSVLANMREAKI